MKPYQANNSSAETVLTLSSDKYNRSNWSITTFTSPRGLGPVPDWSQKMLCHVLRLLESLFFSDSFVLGLQCAPHNLSQHAITHTSAWSSSPPPPQGQLGKMYVYFARYTFGNTITLERNFSGRLRFHVTTICLRGLLFNRHSPVMTSAKAVLTDAFGFRFRAGGVFVLPRIRRTFN